MKRVLLPALLSLALSACNRDGAKQMTAASASPAASAVIDSDNKIDHASSREKSGDEAASSLADTIDDSVITTRVKAALLADDSVDGSAISVETKGGRVMLSGSVSSRHQIKTAVRLTQAVKGVKQVENMITIKK